jgi:hypothetical protein
VSTILGGHYPAPSSLRQSGQAGRLPAHHNPSLQSFADRLREAGKPHKAIITAVARKLVTIANALCKSRQKWTVVTAQEIQLLGPIPIGLVWKFPFT